MATSTKTRNAPRGKSAAAPPTLTPEQTAAAQALGDAYADKLRPAPAPIVTAEGETLLGILLDVEISAIDQAPNVRADLGDLDGLAESIREHGVISPIVVTPSGDRYLLVYGQRRLAASKLVGLERIPAIVDATAAARRVSDVATIQLVENLQRLELNPIERAKALRTIVDSGVSQADLARRLGVGASSISNDLRLLNLAEPVQAKVSSGEITASHAKAIASLPEKQQTEIAKTIVDRGLSTKPMSSHELESTIKWKTDEATSDEARKTRTSKVIPRGITVLEEAGVEKGTPVDVTGSAYSIDLDAARKAIAKAGWPVVDHRRRGYGKLPEGCDCVALQLDLDGRKPKVEKVCINEKHYDRQVNVDHLTRKAEEARLDELVGRLIDGLAPMLEVLPQPALAFLAWRQYGGTFDEVLALPTAELARGLASGRASDYWVRRDESLPAVVEAIAPAPVADVDAGVPLTADQVEAIQTDGREAAEAIAFAEPPTKPATARKSRTRTERPVASEETAPAGLDSSPAPVADETPAPAEPVAPTVRTKPAPKPAAAKRRR